MFFIILLAAQDVVVTGRAQDLTGSAAASSDGRVGARELEGRAILRPGEILETVPGLIVTQHSGTGKANQYFLRGFNLDHGTDFAVWLDGMPINMPTHGHGQGYADVNPLIPELIESIDWRKGPLHAEEGDFAAAGAARLRTFRSLPQGLAAVELGEFGHQRGLMAQSFGPLLVALEVLHYDGPWDLEENFDKLNGLLRYAEGDAKQGWDLTLLGYSADWNSADQIPRRAPLDRFDVIDPTDGGRSRRGSLSGEWRADGWRANAYVIDYRMNLFSNFTYFTQPGGDQFEQIDRRLVFGGAIAHTWFHGEGETTAGLDLRNDAIGEVGLHSTTARARTGTVRDDEVFQTGVGLWVSNTWRWTPWLRTTAGLRGDVYRWDVDSDLDANSGTETDGILSPKLAVALGPWASTEIYAGAGLGFHSNDGRGATITVDPADGVTPVEDVDPLVRAEGCELGLRSTALPGLQSTLSAFLLEIDSELLFIGDAGNTEATRPTRRVGVEWANFWQVRPWLSLDLDAAFTRARFTDSDPAGDRVPGAVEGVLTAGVTADYEGFLAGLRVRWFGPRPLIEDDSERSDDTTLVNARLGYRHQSFTFALEIFNLFDSEDDDITYFYDSQLATEGAPVADEHFHPVEPRNVRLSVTVRF